MIKTLKEIIVYLENSEKEGKELAKKLKQSINDACYELWSDEGSCEAPADQGLIESYIYGLKVFLTEEEKKKLEWEMTPKWRKEELLAEKETRKQ